MDEVEPCYYCQQKQASWAHSYQIWMCAGCRHQRVDAMFREKDRTVAELLTFMRQHGIHIRNPELVDKHGRL